MHRSKEWTLTSTERPINDGRGSGGLPPVAPSGAARSAGGIPAAWPPFLSLGCAQTKKPGRLSTSGLPKTAATYSPNWWVSTIGAGELNCSVRNGKRWNLTAITTALCYLREKTLRRPSGLASDFCFLFPSIDDIFLLEKVNRAISTGQLNTSPCVHFLPINVVVSHDPMGNTHLEDGFALRCFQRLS